MEACRTPFSFGKLFPARKQAPPSENWIITGLLSFLPASNTEFIELEVVQLNAGMA